MLKNLDEWVPRNAVKDLGGAPLRTRKNRADQSSGRVTRSVHRTLWWLTNSGHRGVSQQMFSGVHIVPREHLTDAPCHPPVPNYHPIREHDSPYLYHAYNHTMEPNTSRPFEIVADFSPVGDQPAAIDALLKGINAGKASQCLLGATGTGKTFTMANVIANAGKPALILSHNKTLAAQLYEEMKELFPHNAVAYFVSYYDYFQPEAYIPQRDIYIEKDASKNDDLDRLRLAATSHLMQRNDVIIVASVSCIYGLGSPEEYRRSVARLVVGEMLDRREFLLRLADMQYKRNSMDLERGSYRVRGDVIEVHPAYEQTALRIETFGDEIERIEVIDPLTGEVITTLDRTFIYPAVQYVMPENQLQEALENIETEMNETFGKLESQGKILEAQRVKARTRYDLEMIQEVGYCSGIENYSMHLDGRKPGSRPWTLLDYFNYIPDHNADDWLVFIDESHVTVPQVRGMYLGDQSRKKTLINHGFRLPSALDNRPLRFEEFVHIAPQTIFVSATPGPYELEQCQGEIVEQIIRPTGLLDPEITVLPARGQVPDLIVRSRKLASDGHRVLVTALTKRMCEDLTRYMEEQKLRVRYLHSEIQTLDRIEIINDLREGKFDILVGVNLLREGLDLPEVALVCILDADKQGFLRSATSLIQQMGRAARHVDSQVVMYADKMTPAMKQAIDETTRRRVIQVEHNKKHGITPVQIQKAIRRGISMEVKAQRTVRQAINESEKEYERDELVGIIEKEMMDAAEALQFERAAELRDQVKMLKETPEWHAVKRSDLEGDERTKFREAGRGWSKTKGVRGKPRKRS